MISKVDMTVPDCSDDDWAAAMREQAKCDSDAAYKEAQETSDDFLSADEVDALLEGVLGKADKPCKRELNREDFIKKLQHYENDLRNRGYKLIEKADGIALAIDIAQFELKDTK